MQIRLFRALIGFSILLATTFAVAAAEAPATAVLDLLMQQGLTTTSCTCYTGEQTGACNGFGTLKLESGDDYGPNVVGASTSFGDLLVNLQQPNSSNSYNDPQGDLVREISGASQVTNDVVSNTSDESDVVTKTGQLLQSNHWLAEVRREQDGSFLISMVTTNTVTQLGCQTLNVQPCVMTPVLQGVICHAQ